MLDDTLTTQGSAFTIIRTFLAQTHTHTQNEQVLQPSSHAGSVHTTLSPEQQVVQTT
jgi:hypothetical protein